MVDRCRVVLKIVIVTVHVSLHEMFLQQRFDQLDHLYGPAGAL